MGKMRYVSCPKCKGDLEREITEAKKDVLEGYGIIPRLAYLEKIDKSKEVIVENENLGENFEIGISNGVFIVSYSGSCVICDFEYSYESRKNISSLWKGG